MTHPMLQAWLRSGAFALCALLVAACQPATPKVEGWRPLSTAEVKTVVEARTAEDPLDMPFRASVRGDFNRDGKGDRVVLMVNESQDRFAPYLFDGAGAPPVQLARAEARKLMPRYSLVVVSFNVVRGMCMDAAVRKEGYDERSCDRYADLKGPFVMFFDSGESGAMYVWDGARYDEYPIPRELYG